MRHQIDSSRPYRSKTLRCLLGSAGLLVAGFCTSSTVAASTQAAGLAELQYLPAEAAVVAYANLKDLMGSDLRQRLQELRPDRRNEPTHFQEETGINLETDVDYVVAGMLSRGGESEAVVILKGRFDSARVESFAREHGGVPETYRELRLITGKDDDRTRALAFLAPDLMALGDGSAVRSAIDSHLGESNVTANAEMMKRIAGVAGGTNAWAVGSFDVLASRANLFDGVSTQIPEIQFFSASGRVNEGVVGSLRVEARDDEAAADLRAVLGGFLVTARLQVASQPELQAMLETFELGQTGSTVELSFNLPSQFFESLAPRLRQPAGQ